MGRLTVLHVLGVVRLQDADVALVGGSWSDLTLVAIQCTGLKTKFETGM